MNVVSVQAVGRHTRAQHLPDCVRGSVRVDQIFSTETGSEHSFQFSLDCYQHTHTHTCAHVHTAVCKQLLIKGRKLQVELEKGFSCK